MINWRERRRCIENAADKLSTEYEDIILSEVARISFIKGCKYADSIPRLNAWIDVYEELPPLDHKVIVKCIHRTETDIKIGYKIATRVFCNNPNVNFGFDCEENVIAWLNICELERYKLKKDNIFQKLYYCYKYLTSK